MLEIHFSDDAASRSTYCSRFSSVRFCSSLAIFRGYDTPNRWTLHPPDTSCSDFILFHQPKCLPTHTLTHIHSVSLIPGFSDTRRIPHAGVPSISIKDTLPHQTAWLVATEVANGCKAIFTLALIDSLSCDRPTVYVPRGHYFRFNGAATCGREKKKER